MAAQTFFIMPSATNIVLDASEREIKLQSFVGSTSQLWTLEPAGLGKHFFVNQGNGGVMDIAGGIINGADIITYQNNGGANQRWFINSDNTIASSSGNLALDVLHGNYVPGAKIVALPKHGGANQRFYLQKASNV